MRPDRDAHPRLAILGQLEARLIEADLVVMGDLNEGSWPPPVESGPWLNRAMRLHLGMPPAEQAIGIAAHDFLAVAGAPELVLSRAAKDENGAPTVPSRWIARLQALLAAAGRQAATAPDPPSPTGRDGSICPPATPGRCRARGPARLPPPGPGSSGPRTSSG